MAEEAVREVARYRRSLVASLVASQGQQEAHRCRNLLASSVASQGQQEGHHFHILGGRLVP